MTTTEPAKSAAAAAAPTTYTHGHHEAVLRSHTHRTAADSAAYLLPRLTPGLSLLDVGCGPGTITADLAAAVAPGRVIGVDTVPDVLNAARRTAIDRGLSTVDFTTADVYALPYADDSFDVVHAHQLLQHVADPVAALREMRRVCRPGGTVAVRDADYAAFTWYPDNAGLRDWLELYHTIARENGGEPDAGRRLMAWARAAGFSEVVPTASMWCYATPEDRAWWGGTWADRVRYSSLGEQAVARGHATPDDLGRLAAAWLSWADSPDGWFGVPHGELLCRP